MFRVRARARLAVFVGKATIRLCRLLGRGGSTLPGKVALAIDPGLLTELAAGLRSGSIVVTGTNGKTTTTMLLARILRLSGAVVVYNKTGANMLAGVVSTLIEAAGWTGPLDADWALCEVDEGAARGVVAALLPRALIVTNCFRDQLDRYGEIEHTADLLHRAAAELPASSVCLLNADDPLVAAAGEGVRADIRFFGLECATKVEFGPAADLRHCLRCQNPLVYESVHYAHLGGYHCPNCGLGRPSPHYRASAVVSAGMNGSSFWLNGPTDDGTDVRVGLPGLFNVYNAVAAAAAGLELGVGSDGVTAAIESAPAAFGRMERVEVEGRTVFLALVKNPAGFNEVLAMLGENDGPRPLVIAINDLLADGTDVSWLWDVGFELLAANSPWIIAAGMRATDLALRLKYAGCDMDTVAVIPEVKQAIATALGRVGDGETVYVLPTYTAMLAIRSDLQRRGLANPFWEGN